MSNQKEQDVDVTVQKKAEELLAALEESLVEKISLKKDDFIELVKVLEELVEKKVNEQFNKLIESLINVSK